MEKQLRNAELGAPNTANLVARIITSATRRPIFWVTSAALFIAAGLYLNWPAVVPLGFAPLILTFAPCALMCAMGLCAMSASKNKADGKPPTQEQE